MPDGSVVLVEMSGPHDQPGDARRHEGRRSPSPAAGPTVLAVGPDGKVYVCNNGGFEPQQTMADVLLPGNHRPSRLHRRADPAVDLDTGEVEVLYDRVRRPSRSAGPNDIVFDAARRLLVHRPRHSARSATSDRTGIYYAKADGSSITRGDLPDRRAERHRPVARRRRGLRRGDAHRPGVGRGT